MLPETGRFGERIVRRAGGAWGGAKTSGRRSPPKVSPAGRVARELRGRVAGALRPPLEAAPVLVRGEESLDHLGRDEVAAELVELAQPEVEAREVGVAPLVGVAPQIAEVLHQHEGAVELPPREVGVE